MTCTRCGTEIADNALICYRCGRSTAEPAAAREPRRSRPRQPVWVVVLALLVLVAAGLFMAGASSGRVPDWMRWTVAGAAAVVLVARLVGRRLRR